LPACAACGAGRAADRSQLELAGYLRDSCLRLGGIRPRSGAEVDIDSSSSHYLGKPYPRRGRRRVSAWISANRWFGWGSLKE